MSILKTYFEYIEKVFNSSYQIFQLELPYRSLQECQNGVDLWKIQNENKAY